MSHWLKLPPPDPGILDRISESDINHWLSARLAQLRSCSGLQVRNLEASVSFRQYEETYYDASWTMDASGECAGSQPSIENGLAELHEKILGNPAAKAAEKRRTAQALLHEAEDLEALAKSALTKSK